MSRRRSLDHAKRGLVCALVAAGHDFEEAARQAGCSERTIRRERRRNEEFDRQLLAAQESCAIDPVQLVRRAAALDWRAAAWLLERGKPQEFAPRRPRPCRPAEFDETCTRLIEAALQETPREEDRQRLYRRLYDAADEACRELLDAPGERAKRVAPEKLGPLAADQDFWRRRDLSTARRPPSWPAEPPRDPPPATASAAPEPTSIDPAADNNDPNADNSGQKADSMSVQLAQQLAAAVREKQAQRAASDPEFAHQLSAAYPATDQ